RPEQAILAFDERSGDRVQVPKEFEAIFIFNISNRAKRALEQDGTYTLETVHAQGRLGRLRPAR
ncbi:MAG: hypothetical protein AAFW95_14480, partial [Cyanobacteria bacterium J06638_6]